MSDGSPTAVPAQQLRDAFAAASREDLDGVTADLAPNAVWVMDEVGLGPFEGVEAIREFLLSGGRCGRSTTTTSRRWLS